GIERAVGTNDPNVLGNFPRNQVVHCVRVDLTDPDIRLAATPRATGYIAESRETLTQTVPQFLTQNHLQVAADANYYSANPGGSDPSGPGISCEVFGLQISTGVVVSATASEADPRYASILFTTNNEPRMAFVNKPPGTNTAGILCAITGYYPIVSNGVNIGAASISSYPDSFIHQVQPRTAFGVSQDNRYLYIMSIDGRQSGYSDGALDTETAYWIMQFGAWNAINMDGGGSTSLYMSDSAGNPVPLNHSSYVAAYGHERYVGSHFGVAAKPVPGFINDVNAKPDDTTATISWTTIAPASTQVQFGETTNLGSFSTLSSDLVTNHVALLTGLTPGTGYYYNAVSVSGGTQYASSNFFFVTTNYVTTNLLFDFTNTWSYSTANLDGVNWTAPGYNDSAWDGTGPGALWIDARGPNADIPVPLNTLMPGDPNNSFSPGYPFVTYYFRTHFSFTNSLQGVSLLFTDYIDDGAVFYLNGTEIYRLRMDNPPTVIANATLAAGYGCSGD
ncbi:MAG TPA: phosphodiester glycosidase family protein, partial [Verrucomicrobiae bacterium]|nr:phosphodiester glycosidase family protein [Verrucomicrobiae bacterium]